jgi:tRNA (cmo5U34)-methyltransferase
MSKRKPDREPEWTDKISQQFIEMGPYCVPERELQQRLLSDLVPERPGRQMLIELGCGEGLLAELLLERFPAYHLLALDGSPDMLGAASTRLARFQGRFECRRFSLADRAWRKPDSGALAILSSLVIHHLEGEEKFRLFQDLLTMLAPGGVLAIADLLQPAHPQGVALAADDWDKAVRQRALEIDGHLDAARRFEDQRWNTFRYPDPDDIDHPSGLLEQLHWLERAGFIAVDVHWMRAGQAIISGWKPEAEAGR